MCLALGSVAIIAAYATALQVLVAFAILYRRSKSAVRVLLSALFLLNAAVTFGVVMQAFVETGRLTATDFWSRRWIEAFDDPSGLLLGFLAIAILVSRKSGNDERWPPFLLIPLVATAILTVPFILLQLTQPDFGDSLWYRTVYVQAPLALAYSLLLVVLTVLLIRRRESTSWPLVLLFAGLGVRVVEFAWRMAPRLPEVLLRIPNRGPLLALQDISHLTWIPVVGACLATIIFLQIRGRLCLTPPMGLVLWGSMAAGALLGWFGALATTLTPLGEGTAAFLVYITSLVFVRPVLVGLALDPVRTRRIFLYTTIWFVGWTWSRTALAQWMAPPSDGIGRIDLAAAGIALVVVLAVGLLIHWRELASIPLVKTSGGQRPDSIGERTLRVLLDSYRRDPVAYLTQADLERATGVRRNNVAYAVRQATQLLEADPDGAGAFFIDTRTVGVRGRRVYRLAPSGSGARAADGK